MPDRLPELRRQRALLQEHLDWLDGEITRAGGQLPTSSLRAASPPPPPAPVAPAAAATAAAPVSSSAMESLTSPYQRSSADVQREVKRGCLLYFTAALVLLGFGVLLLYVLISTR